MSLSLCFRVAIPTDYGELGFVDAEVMTAIVEWITTKLDEWSLSPTHLKLTGTTEKLRRLGSAVYFHDEYTHFSH